MLEESGICCFSSLIIYSTVFHLFVRTDSTILRLFMATVKEMKFDGGGFRKWKRRKFIERDIDATSRFDAETI